MPRPATASSPSQDEMFKRSPRFEEKAKSALGTSGPSVLALRLTTSVAYCRDRSVEGRFKHITYRGSYVASNVGILKRQSK